MARSAGPSEVEQVKEQSRALRGHLKESLADGATAFDDDGYSLLKFHGIYQGYDRDSATELKQRGEDKHYQLMVRARIPGGRLTAAQYLAFDALADRHANGTLRLTTRQSIQLHGVLKRDIKATIAAIDGALLTTLAACGDVVRTVTTVPAPIRDAVHERLAEDARRISRHMLPQSRAYHEIWLDGAPVAGEAEETLYGRTYLPRKFKIGIATPEDNSVDVFTNDLGIIALFEGERLQGYNFALGGGLGMTHNNPRTYPRLASLVAFVEPDDLVAAAEAVVKLHRDHGDRSNRRHARLKYIIAEQGEAWAKARLEEYLGKSLEAPRPMPAFRVQDHLGWHEQGDGRLYLGVPVPSGRIGGALKAALRDVVERFELDPVITPTQDVILGNVRPGHREAVESILRAGGADFDLSPARRWSLACPALPTCGLALTEAERVQDPLVGGIEAVLARHGLADETLSIRITGCPNGCARPYAGDIGIVGRMPGFYALFVGGDFAGTRLNFLLLDRVAEDAVATTLEPLFALFAAERAAGEGFGDFCHRAGKERLLAALGHSLKEAS
ncbi:MAG TPA: NADPH-dependent assimilatory sulfite reductase hemoprotein subunit [Stellaceae bacterium]|nr:NADPH-dependent assimilatory sulfite reductase hemoprotein subunit [Stellaceae bacterium]